jgi:hypothetical protein
MLWFALSHEGSHSRKQEWDGAEDETLFEDD